MGIFPSVFNPTRGGRAYSRCRGESVWWWYDGYVRVRAAAAASAATPGRHRAAPRSTRSSPPGRGPDNFATGRARQNLPRMQFAVVPTSNCQNFVFSFFFSLAPHPHLICRAVISDWRFIRRSAPAAFLWSLLSARLFPFPE